MPAAKKILSVHGIEMTSLVPVKCSCSERSQSQREAAFILLHCQGTEKLLRTDVGRKVETRIVEYAADFYWLP